MSTNEESFVESSIDFGGYDPDSIFNGAGDYEIDDDGNGNELNKSIIETTNVFDIFGDSQGNFDNDIKDEVDNENKRQLGETKASMEEQIKIELKQKKIQDEKKEVEDAKSRMEQEDEGEQNAFNHEEMLDKKECEFKEIQVNEENEKQKQLHKEKHIRASKARMKQEDEEDEQNAFEHQEQLKKESELKQIIIDEENQIAKTKAFIEQQEQNSLKQKQLDDEKDIKEAKARMKQEDEDDEQNAFEHQEQLKKESELKQILLDEAKERAEANAFIEQEKEYEDDDIKISQLINDDENNNRKQLELSFEEQFEQGKFGNNIYNNVDVRNSLNNTNDYSVRDSLDVSKLLNNAVVKKNDIRSKMKNMLSSAQTIQRVYRGHIGRKESFSKQLYNERNKLKIREKKQQETILKLKEIENKQNNIINVDVIKPKISNELPPSTYIDDDTGDEILVFKAVRRSKPQLQPNLRISNELIRPDPFPNSPNKKIYFNEEVNEEEDNDYNKYENEMLINKLVTPILSPSSTIKSTKLEFPPTNNTKQNSRPSQIPSLKLKSSSNNNPNNISTAQKSKSGLIGADHHTPLALLREGLNDVENLLKDSSIEDEQDFKDEYHDNDDDDDDDDILQDSIDFVKKNDVNDLLSSKNNVKKYFSNFIEDKEFDEEDSLSPNLERFEEEEYFESEGEIFQDGNNKENESDFIDEDSIEIVNKINIIPFNQYHNSKSTPNLNKSMTMTKKEEFPVHIPSIKDLLLLTPDELLRSPPVVKHNSNSNVNFQINVANKQKDIGYSQPQQHHQQPNQRNKIQHQLRRANSATIIQRVYRGHAARLLAEKRKEMLVDKFKCQNCGRIEQSGSYCKGCGRKKHGGVIKSKQISPRYRAVNNSINKPEQYQEEHQWEPEKPWGRGVKPDKKKIKVSNPDESPRSNYDDHYFHQQQQKQQQHQHRNRSNDHQYDQPHPPQYHEKKQSSRSVLNNSPTPDISSMPQYSDHIQNNYQQQLKSDRGRPPKHKKRENNGNNNFNDSIELSNAEKKLELELAELSNVQYKNNKHGTDNRNNRQSLSNSPSKYKNHSPQHKQSIDDYFPLNTKAINEPVTARGNNVINARVVHSKQPKVDPIKLKEKKAFGPGAKDVRVKPVYVDPLRIKRKIVSNNNEINENKQQQQKIIEFEWKEAVKEQEQEQYITPRHRLGVPNISPQAALDRVGDASYLNEYGKKNSKQKHRHRKNNVYYENNDDVSQYDLRSEPIINNNNNHYQEETSSLPPILSKNTDHIDRNQKNKERSNKVTSAPPRLSLPAHNVRNSHEGYGNVEKQPHVFQRKR